MKSLEQFIADNFSLFLDGIDDVVCIQDKNAILEIMNKAFFKMTGIDHNPYIGQGSKELLSLGLINNSAALKVIETKAPATMNV